MDIKVGNQEAGRMIIGLFGDTVPMTVKNFIDLSAGSYTSVITNKKLDYKGTTFHRIVTDFMA